MKPRAFLSFSISTIFLGAAIAPRASANTDLYWDTNGATAGIGGTGAWDTTATNWGTSSAGSIATAAYDNTNPSSITAQFGGTPGTVTLSATVNVGGMTFSQSGYTITGGTLNVVPSSNPFVYTTNGGTTTVNSALLYPTANTQIRKTGSGTLFLGNGGAGTTTEGFYTVTGGTFNPASGTFDSILSMAAGNRLGTGNASANPATPQVTLDAGTIQFTQTGANNNLANTRGVLVTAAGGAISDGGIGALIPSQITNNAGPSTSLYLTNGSGATLFQGIISGTGSLTWTGTTASNTATFQAANTYSGATIVNTGTVKLDFTGTNTGATRISSSSAVTLNGGGLQVLGTATAAQTTSVTVNGLNVSGPFSTVSCTSGAAGLSSSLTLGAIARTGLGTVNFTLPSTGNITSTTPNTAAGILGGWATLGTSDWASTSAGNITAYTGYLTTSVAGDTDTNYLPTSNVDVTSTQTLTGPISVNTLRFNSASANTLNLTGANTISSGGILVTPVVGNNASAINGGTINGSAGSDLSVYQNDASNALTVGSQIVDNGSATALLKSGAGTLILSNTNSYTGGTRIAGGTLSLGLSSAIGTGDIVFAGTGTLRAGGGSMSLAHNISVGGTGTFDTNGNTLTLTGSISNTALNTAATNSAVKAGGSGTLVLSGSLNLTGSATDTNNPALMLGNRGGENFNRGTVTITGTGSISRISTGWDNMANVLNFASTGTVTMATDFVSGQSANGVGVVNFSTGTLNLQNLNMANWDGSYGAFAMSGGTINTTNLRNGGNGNGNGYSYTLMTGGTINVSTTSTLSRNGNGTNVLNIAGAGAQFNAGTGNFNVAFSADSTGVVTVSSGLFSVNSGLFLASGNTAANYGILNLNGGTVRPNSIASGSAAGISIVNFNGGTLQAGSGSSATFLSGITSANVYSGGVTIDSNGRAINIAQPLLTTTGTTGVSSIPVSTGGAGYLGAPVVKISGGGDRAQLPWRKSAAEWSPTFKSPATEPDTPALLL